LPVQLETERLWRDRLILVGQADVDGAVGRWPGLFPSGAELDEQLITGQLLLAQLLQALHQLLQSAVPHRLFLVAARATAGQDIKLAVLFNEFHLNRVTNSGPGLRQKLLLQLAEPPA